MKCLIILSWLLYHEYPQPQAQAITQNLHIESHCNPESKNRYQIGLAQWQGHRRRNLEQKPNYLKLETQLKFLDQELKQTYYIQYLKFISLKSTNHATIFFCKFYERPQNSKTECPKRAQISNLWRKVK